MVELFIWKWGLYILIIYSFIANACTTTQSKGFWQSDKPWKGTIEANRFNKNPYWQCVSPFDHTFINDPLDKCNE